MFVLTFLVRKDRPDWAEAPAGASCPLSLPGHGFQSFGSYRVVVPHATHAQTFTPS